METYAKALSYAIPGFILLIIIEHLASRLMGKEINRGFDTISSLSSGMTNTLKNLMGLSVVILSYEWMVSHWALFEIKSSVALYLLAFIGLDFAGYWSHRFNHEINVFWNRHIIHHSSEEFNLSCALRQNISAVIGIYFFMYIPMALIGIPAQVVALVAPIHFFSQFWYHTRLINRMGWLEHIIVTPSHHRVHHAINPEYIDKNYSEIFIVWDKWFGTFQEEKPDIPPVYGVKKPVRTWNPFWINFMHLWMIARDAWYTRSWWDKVRVWFMPTGWRPEDVKKRFPVEITEASEVYTREKYATEATPLFLGWSWFQLVLANVLMFYMLVNFAEFAFIDIFLYAAFLMVYVFAYTSAMDKQPWAWVAELCKMIAGFALIYKLDGWYGLDQFLPGATWAMAVYLAFSFGASLYFTFGEKNKSEQEEVLLSA